MCGSDYPLKGTCNLFGFRENTWVAPRASSSSTAAARRRRSLKLINSTHWDCGKMSRLFLYWSWMKNLPGDTKGIHVRTSNLQIACKYIFIVDKCLNKRQTNKGTWQKGRERNKETKKPVYKSLDDRSRGRQRWRGDGQDQDCPAKSAKWICAPSLKNR